MKRPNRYPYTRSQWVEEIVDHYTYKNDICYTSHILENRLTGEIKSKEVEGWLERYKQRLPKICMTMSKP